MTRRGVTAAEDRANGWIEEGPITRIDEHEDSWSITCASGWGCGLRKDRSSVAPKVGDTFTTFGQIGYPFHGQALNGEVLWYQSIEEQEAEQQRQAEEADQRKRDRFTADKTKLDAAFEALPETFRDRIAKFRAANPDFRVEFEAYESMVCVDAVKIARYCSITRLATEFEGPEPTATDNVQAYSKLPYEQQALAGIDGGHSGNSFGMAVRLAWLYVTDPGMVVHEHGAMSALVGCAKYGCHLESVTS